MKKTKKILSIIAIVAIIGFGFTACNPGDDGGGKSDGAAVSAPTLNAKTQTSITVNAVTAPDNGQTVEYGRNTANSAPSTWQNSVTFSGLTANTTYYIFARSKENADYNAGTPSASLEVTTDAAFVAEYEIGDEGPAGGIIFYVDADGFEVQGYSGGEGSFATYIAHYLEAAPTNQAESIFWSTTCVDVTGATGTEIGTGKANTAAIIVAHSSNNEFNNAAKAAVACTEGDENDWFLPSQDELYEMYMVKYHVGISSGFFWSSSQFDSDEACEMNFGSNNSTPSNVNKIQHYNNVRAIRAF